MNRKIIPLLLVLTLVALIGVSPGMAYKLQETPEVTPTPTPDEIVTPTPTPDEIVTPTPTPDEVVTPTPTPDEIVTPTPTPDEIVTPTPTPDEIVTPTPTPDEIVTPTPTPVAPGFGLMITLAGLLIVLFLLKRRN